MQRVNFRTVKQISELAKIIGVFPLFLGLFLSPGFSHIEEGTGNALQLFSYRLLGEKPVIDGSLTSRVIDDRDEKDAPDEWKEAYTRVINFDDGTIVTLFIMNDDDSLYFGTIYRNGDKANGTGIVLYFDQGPTGGEHDTSLTGTSSSDRSDAAYQFIKGDPIPTSDLSWDGSGWTSDVDGTVGFSAAQVDFESSEKSFHREMAIPLKDLQAGSGTNSDLNIELTDEVGLYIELVKTASVKGEFHWIETNGDKTDPTGWADLRLNIPRSCFSFFSTVTDTVVPVIDGNINDTAWGTSYERQIILTNFHGDTISAVFKSLVDPSSGNVYVALQVNDDVYNAGSYAQVYLEEDGTDVSSATRNYFLDIDNEDALRASEQGSTDIFWGSVGSMLGGWVEDTEAADSHAAAGAHNGSSWSYEFKFPFDAGAQDIDMPSFGVAGLFVTYHNENAPAGEQEYYWEFTTNIDNIDVDPKDDRNLSAGWSNLHLGVSYIDIVDIGTDVCRSDAEELEIPVILDTTVIYTGVDTGVVVDPPDTVVVVDTTVIDTTVDPPDTCAWAISGILLQDNNEDGIPDVCQDPVGDVDRDNIVNNVDNCVNIANPDQTDSDGDGIGDLCDADYLIDTDGDNIVNSLDNCINVDNPDQLDSDGDGIGDACDEENEVLVAALRAWIVDEDGDGMAETVYIEFASGLIDVPTDVHDIFWNAAGTNKKQATGDQITFVDGSNKTIVKVDLSDDPYEYGLTVADPDNPPTLTLPNTPQFGGVSVEIEDRVKPVVISAEIIPPEAYLLETDSGLVPRTFPAKLVIQLSEVIYQTVPDTEEPWNSLLIYEIDGMVDTVKIEGDPVVDPSDSTILTFTLATDQDYKELLDNNITLNPEASYTDVAQNILGTKQQAITGEDVVITDFQTFIVEPLLGGEEKNPHDIVPTLGEQSEIKVYDVNGEVVDVKSQVDISTGYWIPPVGLNPDGSINTADADNCVVTVPQTLRRYPKNCLSSILILSRAGYTADVYITDNLGKFIHHHKQNFGQCPGELDNSARDQFPGMKTSYLVWNQKDTEGTLVGSGVFIFEIHLNFDDGKQVHFFKRQGIIRGNDPESHCAEN